MTVAQYYAPGTGFGNRVPADAELADRERILREYEARKKAGYPCGTHTLYRKRP